MPAARLTTRTVDSAKARAKPYILYDDEVRGFGLRVMPSGFKSWIVEYRPAGAGRSANKKRMALGSCSALTAAQARKLAKDTLAGIRGGQDPLAVRAAEKTQITVGDLGKRFLAEHVEKRRKPTTVKFYRMAIERHINPALGKTRVGELKKADILKMHGNLSEKPVLANRAVTIVGSMLTWGTTIGEVPEGFRPTAGVEKNPEKGRERYLSTAELERLGAALRDAETIGIPWDVDEESPTAKHIPKNVARRTVLSPHAVAAIRLLILLGARLREVLHLRWSEVDFERGLLLLPDSKTGKKTIILNAPALEILETVPRIGEYVIAGRPPAKGKKERPRSDLKKSWAAVRRHAGLGAIRLHDLRHSFASVGVGASMGLPIVGKLLGHSNAGTTQRYAHLDADPLRRASNAIGATIAAALDGKAKNNVTPLKPKKHGGERRRLSRSRG